MPSAYLIGRFLLLMWRQIRTAQACAFWWPCLAHMLNITIVVQEDQYQVIKVHSMPSTSTQAMQALVSVTNSKHFYFLDELISPNICHFRLHYCSYVTEAMVWHEAYVGGLGMFLFTIHTLPQYLTKNVTPRKISDLNINATIMLKYSAFRLVATLFDFW